MTTNDNLSPTTETQPLELVEPTVEPVFANNAYTEKRGFELSMGKLIALGVGAFFLIVFILQLAVSASVGTTGKVTVQDQSGQCVVIEEWKVVSKYEDVGNFEAQVKALKADNPDAKPLRTMDCDSGTLVVVR